MFSDGSSHELSPIKDKKPELPQSRHAEMKSFPRWLIVATGLVMLTLIGGGYSFYSYQEQTFRENSEANLQAAAELKVNQLSEWRSEKIRDASLIMKSTFLTEALERFLADPQTELAEKILSQFRSIQEIFDYRDVMLVDRDGQVQLSLRKHHGSLHDEAALSLVEALREERPVMTDLHAGPADLPPHIDVVAPLFSDTGKTKDPNGALIIQIDARHFLYPLIQFWPTPSVSAESLLVRKEGEAVLFLNDLRHQPDTALKLRIPLSKKSVPAVMAVLGKEGIVQGTDYRGVEVLSVLKAIPNSPWFMVSKMDEAEALAGWRFRSTVILAFVIILLALLITTVGVVWQKTKKAHYKELFLTETALRKVEEGHRITLMSVGDAIISTDVDGRVEILNPVAEALTGWRQEEARGRPLEEVFRIFNEETRQPVKNPVSKVLKEGLVVGLANHTVILAREGTERPIADSAAPIRDEHGKMIGVVLVFRDQSEQRAAQRLLVQEKQKAQQYLDVAGAMLLALDTNGHVTLVNKKGCEILGCQEGDILGKDWFEHFLPDTIRYEVKGVFSKIIAGHLETDEYVESIVVTSSGEARLIAWHNSILRDQDGSIIGTFSSGEDITERKRTEENLRDSEARLFDLYDNAPNAYFSVGTDGLIRKCNKGAEQLLGYPKEMLEGKRILDLYMDGPEGKKKAEKVFQKFISGEQVTDEELQMKRADGSPIWISLSVNALRDPDGKVVESRSAVVNITERKAMEEALRESEERYRAVFDNAGIGIDLLDRDGRILQVNQSLLDILGYSEEELRQLTFLDITYPEESEVSKSKLEALMAGEIDSYRLEKRYLRKDGSVLWADLTTSAVRSPNGEHWGTIGVISDVTERKRAEEISLQSARIRAVADLSSGVAHHFNNLLQIVMASTSLSLADLESGDLSEIKTNLQKMLRAATLGAETVKRLQTFANMRADVAEHESAVFDVATTARNAVEVSKPLWKSDAERQGIRIDVQLGLEDGCLVKGHENEIFEVLVNLMRNSAEAMPQGGDIEVKSYKEADEVVVAVRDTGIGIAEGDLPKVFQPFWSSKGVAIGKGMGLAVTHGLVKRHGGSISVDSKVGVGTTFTIRLPLAHEPVSKTEEPAIRPTQGHLLILVIDDDANIASLLERICAKEGHTVYRALSGQDGLEIFKKESVDLVISDLGMPDMNGWDVGKAIRSICQEKGVTKPPFILLTGYGGQELEREKITESGVDAVVAKPIDRATVLATVQEVASRFRVGPRVT